MSNKENNGAFFENALALAGGISGAIFGYNYGEFIGLIIGAIIIGAIGKAIGAFADALLKFAFVIIILAINSAVRQALWHFIKSLFQAS